MQDLATDKTPSFVRGLNAAPAIPSYNNSFGLDGDSTPQEGGQVIPDGRQPGASMNDADSDDDVGDFGYGGPMLADCEFQHSNLQIVFCPTFKTFCGPRKDVQQSGVIQ